VTPAQIDSLWTLLAQTWGAKFLDQYGVKPNDAWSMTLENLSPQAGRYALTALIQEGSAFPPTLPEFIVAARKYRPPVVIHNPGQAIEHQTPMSREALRDGLDQLRRALGLPPRKTNGLEKL
jgi:hypothetical protein